MKRILAAVLVAFAASACASAQTPPEQPKTPPEQAATPQQQAQAELNAGTRAFNSGNHVEAQQHFQRALELDPDNKQAHLGLARAVQQQFRQGDTSPENLAKAEEALAAYKRLLELDPDNEDAYNAVGVIYRQTRDEQKEREWVLARATSTSASPRQRATAYTVLSVKEWQCSRDVTERRDNKQRAQGRGPTAFVYVKPKNPEDFDRARGCATRGLQYAEEAVQLAPDFSHAWASKANLLRELAKLAQMENDEARKSALEQQAAEAVAEQKRASATEAAQRQQEEERKRQEQASAPGGVAVPVEGGQVRDGAPVDGQPTRYVNGGVLDGKAVSKPVPPYPEAARPAGARGRVVVRVIVDEDGNVVTAQALSGHPLLHQAAIEAARQARFTPTLLSGQPVKVNGVLNYDFVP